MFVIQRSLADKELATYLCKQLNSHFPDGREISVEMILSILPKVIKRLELCFSSINNKYFYDGNKVLFNHLHGDQYAMFLYFVSNEANRSGVENDLPSKAFLLNKALHGIDAYFEIELPEIFLFVHPLGTVLGRAKYSNYLMVYQGCGVGSNHDIYPELGEFVSLRPGSFLLGNCKVEKNCTLGARSLLLDRNLPENTLYVGNPMDFKLKTVDELVSIWRV